MAEPELGKRVHKVKVAGVSVTFSDRYCGQDIVPYILYTVLLLGIAV